MAPRAEESGWSWGPTMTAIVLAVAVIGVASPLTNAVPLAAAIPLGLAAAAGAYALQVLIERQKEIHNRERAWSRSTAPSPAAPASERSAGSLIASLHPEQSPVRFNRGHDKALRQRANYPQECPFYLAPHLPGPLARNGISWWRFSPSDSGSGIAGRTKPKPWQLRDPCLGAESRQQAT